MFTNEGKNILKAIGGFLFEIFIAMIFGGMLILICCGRSNTLEDMLVILITLVAGFTLGKVIEMIVKETISDIKSELKKIKEKEDTTI